MRNTVKRILPKRGFSRNVLTLAAGNTIAQSIPLALSPLLTRIYTPKDFGVLGLFLAMTSILGSISNGRYELAIMLPEENEDAINIAALGMVIAMSISVICLIIVILFKAKIADWLGSEEIGVWLYFMPASIILTGLFNVLNYLNSRMKLYKDISKATIYKSVAASVVQLSVGYAKSGATGLISGTIVAQCIANGKLLKNIVSQQLAHAVSWAKIKSVGKRYIDFPKFSMWGGALNSLSQNIISIFISTTYSIATLGHYTLVQKIFGGTSNIIANSFSQVYFQEASEERRKTGKATNSFMHTLKRLILIGLPLALFLFFCVKYIVIIVFGAEWKDAGVYAQILIPFFFLRFISSPLSITNIIFEKQGLGLASQVIIVLSIAVIIGSSLYFKMPITQLLKSMSVTMSIIYLALLFLYWSVARGIKE